MAYDWDRLPPPKSLRDFEAKWAERTNPLSFSGVWRFRELLPFAAARAGPDHRRRPDDPATAPTPSASYVGMKPGRLFLQYEGMNPSGSFKDNGMTAAFTHARMVGARRAACASTGNTSASLAVFCSATGLMRAIIFIGSGKISYGKLAQALDHGALTVQIAGDFDDAMQRVQQVARKLGIYLVNSINPFRLEGQKTIMYRVLEALRWEVARLDRRARRQPRQRQRLRQGVHRTGRPGPDQRACRGWRSSTRPGPTRSISSTSASACAGTAAGRTRP